MHIFQRSSNSTIFFVKPFVIAIKWSLSFGNHFIIVDTFLALTHHFEFCKMPLVSWSTISRRRWLLNQSKAQLFQLKYRVPRLVTRCIGETAPFFFICGSFSAMLPSDAPITPYNKRCQCFSLFKVVNECYSVKIP